MGKGKDLWDDSALLVAFDDAIFKYKRMHGLAEGEVTDNHAKESLPAPDFFSNTEDLQVANKATSIALTSEDTVEKKINSSESTKNPSSRCGSSMKHVDLTCEQICNADPTVENYVAESTTSPCVLASSDVKSKDEAAWCPSSQEEYNKLLESYYNIDYQRQIILQQLNQYSMPGASDPAQYEASPQQFVSVSCHCPYGCQNWVVPCNSSAAPCLGDACINKSCNTALDAEKAISMSKEGSSLAKTAMDAAKTALSSLKIGTSPNSRFSVDEGKENETIMTADAKSEGSDAPTNLADVLNAWYSAGFYTGKYLSEQSFDKRNLG